MISTKEQPLTERQAYDAMVKRNTNLLEHVMSRLGPEELLSDLLLTQDTHIRFTYDGTRFIYYHSGHVTICDPERGVEIGGMLKAQAMKDLLNV